MRFSNLALGVWSWKDAGQAKVWEGKGRAKRWRWGENRLPCEWGRYESNFPPSRSGMPLVTYRLSRKYLVQSLEARAGCGGRGSFLEMAGSVTEVVDVDGETR